MHCLSNLKNTIESMSRHHQIELLRILHQVPGANMNENQNGTFVNLNSLSDKDIKSLTDYIDYVNTQQESLSVIEAEKKTLQHKYFNDNKDISIR